jgi:hypothetical protein
MDAGKHPGLLAPNKGLHPDDAALSAWEAGYFPELGERPSIDALHEAVRAELAGKRRYRTDDVKAAEAADIASAWSEHVAATLGSLDAARGMTEAELADALELAGGRKAWEPYAKGAPLSDQELRNLSVDALLSGRDINDIASDLAEARARMTQGRAVAEDGASEFDPPFDMPLDEGDFELWQELGEPAITPEISAVIRRQAGPIRLQMGDEKAGLVHIEKRHGEQARSLGYADARAMVEDILQNFDAIYKGNGRALILAKRTPNRGQAYVQLEPSEDGDFYDVKTATPSRVDQFKNREPLWEHAGPNTSPDESGIVNPSIQSGENIITNNDGDLKQSARGSYTPATNTIRLFATANLSTLAHETGHKMLFEMLDDLGDTRVLPAAREQIVNDVKAVFDHLGVKGADPNTATPEALKDALSVEQHETFARSFQAYLREGRTPSPKSKRRAKSRLRRRFGGRRPMQKKPP